MLPPFYRLQTNKHASMHALNMPGAHQRYNNPPAEWSIVLTRVFADSCPRPIKGWKCCPFGPNKSLALTSGRRSPAMLWLVPVAAERKWRAKLRVSYKRGHMHERTSREGPGVGVREATVVPLTTRGSFMMFTMVLTNKCQRRLEDAHMSRSRLTLSPPPLLHSHPHCGRCREMAATQCGRLRGAQR